MAEDSDAVREGSSWSRIYLAYTQTSSWDLDAPSGPFKDSSYKPTLLWLYPEIGRVSWLGGSEWGIELGAQHESNGRDGEDSRSLNVFFMKPSLTLWPDSDWNVTLSPRLNLPISDPEDTNYDIERYRGYFDYQVKLTRSNDLEVALLARLGTGGYGSLQADVSYPLNQFCPSWPNVFVNVQGFHGYGETLLGYNQSTDQLRFGISISR